MLDASVVTDALVLKGDAGERARAALGAESALHVPDIMEAKVASALRRQEQAGAVSSADAAAALDAVTHLRLARYPFRPFARRAWSLRHNVTPYDAWYVALAEALEAELLTGDRRLLDAPGPRCVVRPP